MTTDPYAQFKAVQREAWASFVPLAAFTTPAAACLVKFAGIDIGIGSGQRVLDVACGTGVVAVTAARSGAQVSGLDLSPVLLEHARANAALIDASIDFTEGDAEALPYPDASFDVVLSQFGHMFAPRPQVAVAEMLRVLRPGGRIAFSTWPPELMIGGMFRLTGQYLSGPAGVASPADWGDPAVVRARLGDAVTELVFDCGEMTIPALSPRHYRANIEATAGPVAKTVESLAATPARLGEFREALDTLITRYFEGNRVRQTFLMTRAIKR